MVVVIAEVLVVVQTVVGSSKMIEGQPIMLFYVAREPALVQCQVVSNTKY